MPLQTLRGLFHSRTRLLTMAIIAALLATVWMMAGPSKVGARHGLALDHFRCYLFSSPRTLNPPPRVDLFDQFLGRQDNVMVASASHFCHPVEKDTLFGIVARINNPETHLTFYNIEPETLSPFRQVLVTNQFVTDEPLKIGHSFLLAVPTEEDGSNPPLLDELDHFRCYKAFGMPPVTRFGQPQNVDLKDGTQHPERQLTAVREPVLLCNPTVKIHKGQVFSRFHPDEHLVCYKIDAQERTRHPEFTDQFGPPGRFNNFHATPHFSDLLCVPSKKRIPVPDCVVTAVNLGPPVSIDVTVSDPGGGIVSIEVLTLVNAKVEIPKDSGNFFGQGAVVPFAPPELSVIVKATKLDPNQSGRLDLRVTDTAGNVIDCDPEVTLEIRENGKPVSHTFQNIPQAESKVTVLNGDPGVKNLGIDVNGTQFSVAGLKDGEQRSLDISSVMVEGDNNTITLTAKGKPGGSVTVVISD